MMRYSLPECYMLQEDRDVVKRCVLLRDAAIDLLFGFDDIQPTNAVFRKVGPCDVQLRVPDAAREGAGWQLRLMPGIHSEQGLHFPKLYEVQWDEHGHFDILRYESGWWEDAFLSFATSCGPVDTGYRRQFRCQRSEEAICH